MLMWMIANTNMEHKTIDYKKLGFRCGLEIHQQLEGRKLFCNCPTLNTDKSPNLRAIRKLRAVVGETGEIDTAAAHETAKGKEFLYESHSLDTCMIEYDEEPPLSLNKEALETALKVALLLDATVVDEVQVMRKIVVDGSNVSGFQRTALIAMDGHIETSLGRVNIPTICLEEEAAQKLEGKKDAAKYKLDRLGIPLIEIATSASILSGEHAKEAASHLGMVLRSVEGIKRGIGTIRQDVNVSIEKGSRVEVKGFQDLRSIPKVVEFEVGRQLDLISNGKKVEKEVRKAEPDFTTSFLRPMPGSSRMYPETDVLPIPLPKNYVAHLKKSLPKLKSDRLSEYKEKYQLPDDMAKDAIEHAKFEGYVRRFSNVSPLIIAQVLFTIPKDMKTRLGLDISLLKEQDYEEILLHLHDKKIPKDASLQILSAKIKGETIDLSEFAGISDEELEQSVKAIISQKPGLSVGSYMGLVMAKHRGKVEGKKVMDVLKKMLQ
jgi:Glu-tRNA(Gln) amidotransferase subunit E-like FAD-binding protein